MIELKDLFEKDFLLEIIKDCEGLKDIIEHENYFEVYDEEDMFLNFHHKVDYDDLFDFGSLKVDKDKFLKMLNDNIEKTLFLMPKKIYFISTKEELNLLTSKEEYESQSMDFKNVLGVNWTYDSTIVINVSQCRIVAKEISQVTKSPFDDVFNEAIWTTLIHELRHMICDLAVIIPEEIIPISECSEEKVEIYGNNCFWNKIVYEDYKCFI